MSAISNLKQKIVDLSQKMLSYKYTKEDNGQNTYAEDLTEALNNFNTEVNQDFKNTVTNHLENDNIHKKRILKGYLNNNTFYIDNTFTDFYEAEEDIIYIDLSTLKEYIWIINSYEKISYYEGSDTDISDLPDKNNKRLTWDAKQDALTADTDYLTPNTASSTYEPKKQATELYVTENEKNTWNAKQNKLEAGSNVDITDNVISATNTTYEAADFDIKDIADSNNKKGEWDKKVDYDKYDGLTAKIIRGVSSLNIIRNPNEEVIDINYDSGRNIAINRDYNNVITSLEDNDYEWAIDRDYNGVITGITVNKK